MNQPSQTVSKTNKLFSIKKKLFRFDPFLQNEYRLININLAEY